MSPSSLRSNGYSVPVQILPGVVGGLIVVVAGVVVAGVGVVVEVAEVVVPEEEIDEL